jgi:primosomal protein N' (replication factor Y)
LAEPGSVVQRYARVAIPVPLGQAFSYSVPPAIDAEVRPGARVLCSFGKRTVLGIVLDVSAQAPDFPADKIKPLRRVLDGEPVLPDELVSFLLELARYYVAPIGAVMELALPVLERSAAEQLSSQESFVVDRAVGRLVQSVSAAPGAVLPEGLRSNARELFCDLLEHGPRSLRELEKSWGTARGIVKRLEAQGLVVRTRVQEADDPFAVAVERDVPPELTQAQAAAVTRIVAAMDGQGPKAFLVDGVTASGKTEVYLRAVEHALGGDCGSIVLVPEIALTPQLTTRFRARLGDRIAVLHSGLGERERQAMWRALRSGRLRVAVGARSALFAPVQKLGLICVDEEHDGSFKQEEGVRYHARDMALLRAHRAGAVCVLGSATPSLSSRALVSDGKLELLVLPARARENARMPAIEVVDLRRVGAGPGGDRLLSLTLFRALETVLERKQQAILFLNRRGFAPSLLCGTCGAPAECPNCSVALTLHRSRGERLRCHYCDYSVSLPVPCAACGATEFMDEGSGTERIESLLQEVLPQARVARLDRDVAAGAKSAKILERMRRAEIDILVGTQMVTKGHDLPQVTLVGVLNADAALSMPDFRAAERSFQLLVQVAGRAGRGDAPGRVLIQTRQPEHPAIACAVKHDMVRFNELELLARKELGYPPFSRLALIRFDAVEEKVAESETARLAAIARAACSAGAAVLGPAVAPLARLRGRYRYRFLLRAPDRSGLRAPLLAVARTGVQRGCRMAIDVDPVNML